MPWTKLTKSTATSSATISDMDGNDLQFMDGTYMEFVSGSTWSKLSSVTDSWTKEEKASD